MAVKVVVRTMANYRRNDAEPASKEQEGGYYGHGGVMEFTSRRLSLDALSLAGFWAQLPVVVQPREYRNKNYFFFFFSGLLPILSVSNIAGQGRSSCVSVCCLVLRKLSHMTHSLSLFKTFKLYFDLESFA